MVNMLLKKRINIILIIAFFLLTPYLASARPGYASKENVGCSYCHSNDGRSQLNQVGIYYRNNGYSLQGYNTSAQENTSAQPAVTETQQSEGTLKTLPSDFSVVFSLAGIIAIILSKKQI